MLIILAILIALVVAVAVGTILYNRFAKNKTSDSPSDDTIQEIPIDCCGAHDVCEVEAMIQNPNEILYFEDEELDRFRGFNEHQYNETDLEEFRDVLYTLKDDDEIKMWLISIERRGVKLPSIIKLEALQML